jgi:hypothetical protein
VDVTRSDLRSAYGTHSVETSSSIAYAERFVDLSEMSELAISPRSAMVEKLEQRPGRLPRIPRKPSHPFVSADNRPEGGDGVYRVVIMTSGSVASIKLPDIVGALCQVSRAVRLHALVRADVG